MRRLRNGYAATVGAVIIAVSFPTDVTAQIPTVHPPAVHGCLRPDVEKTTALLRKATEKGAPSEEVKEVQKEVKGCVAYTVTFESAVSIVSNAPTGGTSKISGVGSIIFGLAPDMSEPEYELTSGPSELTAPIYWSGAEITRGNKCIVRILPLPATAFAFWLGLKSGAEPKASVQVSPSGDEAHPTMTKCPKPLGGWSNEVPGREPIFSPAWIALHGTGGGAAGAPVVSMAAAMDPKKMQAMAAAQKQPGQGMDMKKMMEMADKLKDKPPSADNMAEMMTLMKEVVPDADQRIEAARNNFMFKMPGDCTAVGALVRCTINRKVTVPDFTGSTQTITEATVITIVKGLGR